MPLYVGSQKIKTLSPGGQKVKEGWQWNGTAWKKVFSTVPPFGFVDEFNTAYPDSLGPAWTYLSGVKGRVVNGHAVLAGMGTTGKVSYWYRPTGVVVPQDDVAVRLRITAPTPYLLANDNETIVALHCTDDAATNDAVWAVFMGGKVRIMSIIGGTQAVRSPDAVYPVDVDLEFRAVGRSFSIVRVDTQAVLTSWLDSGNESKMDASHRAFKIALTGNFPLFQQQYNSPALDRFEARLPDASPGKEQKKT
ncbi:MAG: hypothetical protein JWN03_7378 [Nocardia sp.]|uniref:hypothetical protein n=1 Tax=Nocardia sp. TaxID=1821 RepID=UPI002621184E|nr:hypothetical protein [Nocardia sp.]MCU1647103.1 hypothetical protein [Nocardia sp.]